MFSDYNFQNIENLCKICLSESKEMTNIDDINTDILDLFDNLINFKASFDGITLKNLCLSCKERLEAAYDLIVQAKKSREILKFYIESKNDDIVESTESLEVFSPNYEETKRKLVDFTYDDIMREIRNVETLQDGDITCIQCDFVGINKKALISHMAIVHKEFKDKWCPICNEIHVDLPSHKSEHQNCALRCKFCGLKFCIRKNLVRHLLNHSRTNEIKPEITSGKVTGTLNEKLGGKTVKTESKLCTVCGKQFRSSSRLQMHMKTHSDVAEYSCRFCAKNCATRTHLVTHERVHTGQRPYVCSVCDKSFNQSSILKTHQKTHTGKTIPCSLCDKKFTRPCELKVHFRTHTGEKPFHCQVCDKAFIQKSHLLDHEKTHLYIKPYKCLYCERAFAQKSTLKTHIAIHLGIKSYKCELCAYSARQSYVLKMHMKQHEKDTENGDDL